MLEDDLWCRSMSTMIASIIEIKIKQFFSWRWQWNDVLQQTRKMYYLLFDSPLLTRRRLAIIICPRNLSPPSLFCTIQLVTTLLRSTFALWHHVEHWSLHLSFEIFLIFQWIYTWWYGFHIERSGKRLSFILPNSTNPSVVLLSYSEVWLSIMILFSCLQYMYCWYRHCVD